MSNGFLSVAERERWQRFPDTIPQDDLAAYFLLSDDDQREINRQREPFNRLGYALQLCMLRYLDQRAHINRNLRFCISPPRRYRHVFTVATTVSRIT